MIGNNFDMVNCYGFMSHMTFDQQEYNSDHFQCDSVQTHPNREYIQFITIMLKTQPVNSHWFTVSLTMLSVGFVIAMDNLFEFDS